MTLTLLSYDASGGARMNPNTSRVGVDILIGGARPYRTIRGRFDGSSEKGNPLNWMGLSYLFPGQEFKRTSFGVHGNEC
jgi:hypothetical protein